MGKYKHHSGAIGGGVNLSKEKTPHDSLMKYMPIDDKASGLFKMKSPFEMGMSKRGPLDKHGMHKGPDMHGKKHDGPDMHGKKHDGPSKYMDHKGPGQYKQPLHQAKPDFPDIDGDGNTSESMKQAAKDKKMNEQPVNMGHKKP